jgi:hypothetical protein
MQLRSSARMLTAMMREIGERGAAKARRSGWALSGWIRVWNARSCFGAQTSIPATHDKHHALRGKRVSAHDAIATGLDEQRARCCEWPSRSPPTRQPLLGGAVTSRRRRQVAFPARQMGRFRPVNRPIADFATQTVPKGFVGNRQKWLNKGDPVMDAAGFEPATSRV